MNSLLQRYVAAIVGFGFMAVWVSAGVSSAVICLVCSAGFYLGAVIAEKRRLSAFTSRFMERRDVERARRAERSRPRRERSTPTGRPAPVEQPAPQQVYDESRELEPAYEYGW